MEEADSLFRLDWKIGICEVACSKSLLANILVSESNQGIYVILVSVFVNHLTKGLNEPRPCAKGN
jgi:hypothetical protein